MNTWKEHKQIIAVPRTVYNDRLLVNKIALITGGNSGIGYAIADAFLASGAKIVIVGRDKKKNEKAEEKLKKKYSDMFVKSIQLDVAREVEAFREKIIEAASLFPEGRFDILVNAAGVMLKCNFWNMTLEEYNLTMDTNVRGMYFMCKEMGRFMQEKSVVGGHILNISSTSSLAPARTPYRLSKWAVRGLTLGIAEAFLPYGIIVNALAPGRTATAMLGRENSQDISDEQTLNGRLAIPEEIAPLAVVLVSPLGDSVVGETLYATFGNGIF